jgi:hypothetical protein
MDYRRRKVQRILIEAREVVTRLGAWGQEELVLIPRLKLLDRGRWGERKIERTSATCKNR